MGFSLARALAGAIAGGAGATAQIADQQIKEAAVTRQREADFERQRQLMREQDEIMAAREQRVAETKAAAEKARRKEVSDFMLAQTDILAKQKINPGSIAGQQALATAAARAGYQDYADKFYDNAIRISQIESNEGIKAAERGARMQVAQIAHAAARERREERANEKLSDIEKRTWKEIDDVVGGFKLETYDREGRKGAEDTTGYTEAKRLVEDMKKRGAGPDLILNNMLNFKSQFDEIRNDPTMKGARGSQLVDATAKFITEATKQKEKNAEPVQEKAVPAQGNRGGYVPISGSYSAPVEEAPSESFFSLKHSGPGFSRVSTSNGYRPTPAPDEPNFLDRIEGGWSVGYGQTGRPGGVLNKRIP